MGTKTISITTEAYERLKTLKENKESFSEIIVKITKKDSIMTFFGALSEKSAERLEKNIKKIRKTHKENRLKRIDKIKKQLEK